MPVSSFLLRSGLLFLLFLAPARGERVHRLRLDFGAEGFAARPSVTVSGDVVRETLQTRMGTLQSEHAVLTFGGAGSGVELRLPNPGPETDVILEMREAHDRRPQAFGYELRVNGSPVYFRTYQELGAGPNHYFVRIPPALRGEAAEMTLGIHSRGGGPFSLETLWVYEDFFQRVGTLQPLDERMGLVIPHEHLRHPGEIESYGGLRDFELIGTLGFAGYGYRTLAGHEETLTERLAFSAETGLPILLVANGTGWGGKPEAPDGAGGYFSDPQYSIMDWNREAEAFRVSWPGMWGLLSTPTLRNPRLNDYLYTRFERVYGDLRGRMARAWRDGAPFTPWIIREFAPVSGEVSAENRRVAAEEGIDLDPRDGLSFEERLWMHQDAAQAWQGFADSTVSVVGLDPVVVDRGKVRPPVTQLRDDLYSHPDFLGTHPVNDPRWSGGQMGMVDGLWSSGEMGKGDLFRDLAMYDYLRARGRLAMINMERTILKDDFSMLRGHYAHGFDFVCLFNAYRGDAEVAARVDGFADTPAPRPAHREPVLLDLRFRRDRSPGPAEHLVNMEGLHPHPCGLAVAVPGIPGSITYRLPPPEAAMGAGLMLEVDGRISEGEGNRIEVFHGTDPAALRRVAVWTREDLPPSDVWTPFMTTILRLPMDEEADQSGPGYLRLVFHAEGGHDAAFLNRMSVNRSWDRLSGHEGDAEPFTHRELRILQRRVQARAMTGIWLNRYLERAGGEADTVYTAARAEWEAGHVVEAGRTVRAAISELLPAEYWVRGHGPLGRWPLEVTLPEENDAVRVELLAADAERMEFRLDGLGREIDVDIAFAKEGGWAKTRLGPSHYQVRRVPDGQRRHRFRAGEETPPEAPGLPRELTARFLDREGDKIRVDVGDLDWMGHDLSLRLPLAETARIIRRQHADDARETVLEDTPEFLDRVRLRLNDSGEVEEVLAETGRARGRIVRYQPPRLFDAAENGWIELDNGERYALHYGQRDGVVFDTVALNGHIMRYELRHLELALRPGHEVELAYTPPLAEGALPRLFRVRQAYRTLMAVDFGNETGDNWRAAAKEARGVEVREHRPEPNYLYKLWFSVMRPERGFEPGHVIYAVEAGEPLGTTAVEFTARAFEDSSRVTFYVSTDGGETWTECGRFDNTWQNNISQELHNQPPQAIDLTPAVRGHAAFLLKVELVTHPDDGRFCLRTLSVRTEASVP